MKQSIYVYAIICASGNLRRAWAAAQGGAPLLKFTREGILAWQRKYRAALAVLETIPDTPDNFPASSGPKALYLANLYWLAGDNRHAKPLYAKALQQAQAELKAQAGNTYSLANLWATIATAQFGLGERQAAFAATAKSLKLAARLKDPAYRWWVQYDAAVFYALAGRADLAVPLLAKLLAAPGAGAVIAPIGLRLSPYLDPIRHDPRFQALLKKYPAPTPVTAAAPASTD